MFQKCFEYKTADNAKRDGYYPYFRPIESAQDTEVYIRNKKHLMLGSNSYLGLTNDPRVKEASIKAIEKYGTGCAGSRFLNGTLDIHEELEERLAKFTNKESALLYSTGFQVNQGVISTLVGREDVVLTDSLDHASIIDGARLAFGKTFRFNHNDMDDLETKLKNAGDKGKLIVVDGIFSMEGDIVNLPEIVKLAKKYNAGIMVDDAHSLGVLGKNGRGTANHFQLDDETDLIMGTFSKSLASLGGFVAGNVKVIDFLKHHSRALIFSASPTPASVAAAMASLDIMETEPERIEKLWANTNKMLKGFKELGYNTGIAETPIIPLVIGDDMLCFKTWKALSEAGIFINPVIHPAVPHGHALIRTSYMATHTSEQLDFALDSFKKIGKNLSII
ncbi:MAG: aminotransferase class I/II-fold pyridoxal phosphate-dependent enzyme [Spirochaetes bacterium]|nr:aminotransferase class I/II-fold pyridoxal phosphate-dependent enzyme [Spirochaetota bacterium]